MPVPRDLIPYPGFNFLVNLGGANPGDLGDPAGGFSEVTGLKATIEAVKYRVGNHLENNPVNINMLTSFEDVTLKRGVIGRNELFEWLMSASRGEIDRRDVVIQHLDEARNVVNTWTLVNAQIKEWSGVQFKSDDNQVVTEEIVVHHEGLRWQ